MRERFLEIDALRGAAVCAMIIFHALFDYTFFISPATFDLYSGFWFWFGRATAVIFVLLAGTSLTLHVHRKQLHPEIEWRKLVQRGIFILSLGLIISLISFLAYPAYAIWFGVLHFMGVSLILGILFVHRPRASFILGLIIVLLGVLFSTIFHSNVPFWPILLPVSFSTFDYFPLFPWFGIFLLGIAAGHFFYPRGVPHSQLGWKNGNGAVNILALVGKKSLIIYFLHQPILIGIILLAQKIVW